MTLIIHSSPGITLLSLCCVCILCLIILWGLSISSDIERSYSSLILLRLMPLGERQFYKTHIFKTYWKCLLFLCIMFIISLHYVNYFLASCLLFPCIMFIISLHHVHYFLASCSLFPCIMFINMHTIIIWCIYNINII